MHIITSYRTESYMQHLEYSIIQDPFQLLKNDVSGNSLTILYREQPSIPPLFLVLSSFPLFQ